MLKRTILPIASLCWLVPQMLASEPPKYKPINAKTVVRAAGGTFHEGSGGFYVTGGPAFRFDTKNVDQFDF